MISCLRCGKRGDHKETAYASSRGCVEQGKVCDDCWRAIMQEKANDQKWKWYGGMWSLTKAGGRVGY